MLVNIAALDFASVIISCGTFCFLLCLGVGANVNACFLRVGSIVGRVMIAMQPSFGNGPQDTSGGPFWPFLGPARQMGGPFWLFLGPAPEMAPRMPLEARFEHFWVQIPK